MIPARPLPALALPASWYAAFPALAADEPRRPNFLVLLTDDMGYGDPGSYGHPVHRTPHIDELAAAGQRWTNFYAPAAVCTPSRGALLTGRLPIRIGLEAPRGMPDVFFPFSTGGLPRAEITLAELLGSAGYATALIGKWHLGFPQEYSPNAQGFDLFYGTPGSNDMDPVGEWSLDLFFKEPDSADWDVPLYRNREIMERPAQQETLTQRYTDEAIGFMREHRDRPFFVLLSYNMPHVPLFARSEFRRATHGGLYAAAVEEIDWSVGRLVAALRELGLAEDTIVVFTSDNGPIGFFRQRGGSAGLLRGGKGTTWEGGFRVPGIFWGPRYVAPGPVYELGSQLDLFATFADLADLKLPTDRVFDSHSLRATLARHASSGRDILYYYRRGEICAIRDGVSKVHFITEGSYGDAEPRVEHDPPLLFDLSRDPAERFPIATPDPVVLRRFVELRERQQSSVTPVPSELIKGVPVEATTD